MSEPQAHEGFPLPAIFLQQETDMAVRTPEPVGWVTVQRVCSPPPFKTIASVSIEQLTDEMDLARYGPGTYHLIGRPASRQGILRRVTLTIDQEDAAPDTVTPPAPPPLAPAPQASTETSFMHLLLSEMRSSRDMMMQLLANQNERTEKTWEGVVKVISSTFTEVQKVKAAASGSGDLGTMLDRIDRARENASEQALASVLAAKEAIGSGETDEEGITKMINAAASAARAIKGENAS